MRPWLTVDSDDLRHLPKFQGHPRRSKPIAQERISSTFQLGMQRFSEWLDTHNFPVTMFVIADQLEDAIFSIWLKEQIKKHPHLTIGCHGFRIDLGLLGNQIRHSFHLNWSLLQRS